MFFASDGVTPPTGFPVTATQAGITITVNADFPAGRLLISLRGGPEGQPVYVLRRDRNGTTLVRQTSAGTVLWRKIFLTTDAPTISEYEARQGLDTDFIVTDLDGLPLVSVRLTVPTWGTWLKSPGQPGQNVRCAWKGDLDYTRRARQSVLAPRGAKFPIVLADRRLAPIGQVRLLTRDQITARALTTLLDSGQVLMIDVPDSHGVPVRYVSVGDVKGSRLAEEAHSEVRVWTLEVSEVAAPVGLAAGQGFTYEGLAATADSYIGLAANYSTYDDLAIGQVT